MDLMGIEYRGYAIVPIIVGICEIFKKFDIEIKFIPIIALILGLIFSAMMGNADYTEIIFRGLTMGLGAVGLHSGFINVKEGIEKSNV